jgi:hypothetical protein
MHINPLNAELNRVCHLLALLGAHHILHVSRIRVNTFKSSAEVSVLFHQMKTDYLLVFFYILMSKLPNFEPNFSAMVALSIFNLSFIVKVQGKAVPGLAMTVPGG